MKKEFKTRSIKENLAGVMSFLDENVKGIGFDEINIMEVKMCCEKVFLNINQAAKGKVNDVKITFRDENNKAFFEFFDNGEKFDPTSQIKKDFDVKKLDNDFGINFMSKLINSIEYYYENGENKLVLVKSIPQKKDLEIEEQEHDGTVFLTLIGRVDTTTAPILDKKFSELFSNAKKVISVDMDPTNYVSSAGLRGFLIAQKEINKLGGKLTINNVSEMIYSVFSLTGFADIMDIHKK